MADLNEAFKTSTTAFTSGDAFMTSATAFPSSDAFMTSATAFPSSDAFMTSAFDGLKNTIPKYEYKCIYCHSTDVQAPYRDGGALQTCKKCNRTYRARVLLADPQPQHPSGLTKYTRDCAYCGSDDTTSVNYPGSIKKCNRCQRTFQAVPEWKLDPMVPVRPHPMDWNNHGWSRQMDIDAREAF